MYLPGCEGHSLVMLLDAQGIEVSTGSACTNGVPHASHVLLAMGASETHARANLRVSLGHTTTEADVDGFVEAVGPVVQRARIRSLRPIGPHRRPGGLTWAADRTGGVRLRPQARPDSYSGSKPGFHQGLLPRDPVTRPW